MRPCPVEAASCMNCSTEPELAKCSPRLPRQAIGKGWRKFPGVTSTPRPVTKRRCSWGCTTLTIPVPWPERATLNRLREVPEAAERFEPGLSVAVAACWQQAGEIEKAKETLDFIRGRFPEGEILIGGRAVSLADAPRALASAVPVMASDGREIDQWTMFHGNPARNGSANGSGPLLSIGWRVSNSDRPNIDAAVEEICQSNRDRDRWAIPTLRPLLVNGVVLMRTLKNLLAVDLTTGKRLWEVPTDDPFDAVSDASAEQQFAMARPDLRTQLRFRIWGDATYGTLSSDGQYVFAVEDLPLDAGFTQNQFMFANRRDAPTDSRSFNRLAAYDIRTGKLVWHVGGSPDDLGLPLAGSFFLGPPLPLAGVLYVIADYKGEVRLIALETQSGKQLWTQQLAETDQQGGILQSPLRRLSGVSPSYADGVLVCPTANKLIVALDLVTRSLLWGYAYADRDINARQPTRMFFGPRQVHVDLEPSARWTDSSATIAEGRVLVTPIDSNHLDCLNLVDGKLLWRKPREDSLYLAGVHRGKAIVVGRRSIRALQLANGEPAWEDLRGRFSVGCHAERYGLPGRRPVLRPAQQRRGRGDRSLRWKNRSRLQIAPRSGARKPCLLQGPNHIAAGRRGGNVSAVGRPPQEGPRTPGREPKRRRDARPAGRNPLGGRKARRSGCLAPQGLRTVAGTQPPQFAPRLRCWKACGPISPCIAAQ